MKIEFESTIMDNFPFKETMEKLGEKTESKVYEKMMKYGAGIFCAVVGSENEEGSKKMVERIVMIIKTDIVMAFLTKEGMSETLEKLAREQVNHGNEEN